MGVSQKWCLLICIVQILGHLHRRLWRIKDCLVNFWQKESGLNGRENRDNSSDFLRRNADIQLIYWWLMGEALEDTSIWPHKESGPGLLQWLWRARLCIWFPWEECFSTWCILGNRGESMGYTCAMLQTCLFQSTNFGLYYI